MSHNSSLPAFGVIALWSLNIAIFTMYSCQFCKLKTIDETSHKCKASWDNVQNISTMYSGPFYKLKTVPEILMKLHKNVHKNGNSG